LTVILGDVGVYELDYIGTDGSSEYSGKRSAGGLFSRKRKDGKNRASSHGERKKSRWKPKKVSAILRCGPVGLCCIR
jgi:hypothetical protein